MEKLIACCGLDCASCDARIATVNNDDDLRKATAGKWSTAYNIPDLSYETINCTGCMEAGAKISHCSECEIRNCVISRGYKTCADCSELETCKILEPIRKNVPDALSNLKGLN